MKGGSAKTDPDLEAVDLAVSMRCWIWFFKFCRCSCRFKLIVAFVVANWLQEVQCFSKEASFSRFYRAFRGDLVFGWYWKIFEGQWLQSHAFAFRQNVLFRWYLKAPIDWSLRMWLQGTKLQETMVLTCFLPLDIGVPVNLPIDQSHGFHYGNAQNFHRTPGDLGWYRRAAGLENAVL